MADQPMCLLRDVQSRREDVARELERKWTLTHDVLELGSGNVTIVVLVENLSKGWD